MLYAGVNNVNVQCHGRTVKASSESCRVDEIFLGIFGAK